MKVIELLIDEDKKDYKYYSELSRLLDENQEFMEVVISGLIKGKIRGFDEKLWNDIHVCRILEKLIVSKMYL